MQPLTVLKPPDHCRSAGGVQRPHPVPQTTGSVHQSHRLRSDSSYPVHVTTASPVSSDMCFRTMFSDKRRLPSVRRTLQRLFSSTSSSGQIETQVRRIDLTHAQHFWPTAQRSRASEICSGAGSDSSDRSRGPTQQHEPVPLMGWGSIT